ncbi:MAG: class flavin-dependent oxidoreductase [Nocardioides sp.]|jgi:alkanesulfonate monooxygenase SsuD/methylene tetrahydromethanopterin reductase-like flavin-dependent oxidoreductase (luciferase family)|nr:class flavin-dependent oxidoreductase [Nocardioides sp.]
MNTTLGLLVPLTPAGYGPHEESLLEQAVLKNGVGGLWIRDLPCVPAGDTDAGQLQDPFAYITAMAPRTADATYGLAVAIAGARHPLVLARAAVSAQYYTNNRFILGIGTGGKQPMSQALGVWGRSVEEFVSDWRQVRQALTGDGGDGLVFHLPEGYRPPPMWLATARPEYWEPLSGAVDGWMTGFLLPKAFEEKRATVTGLNGHTSVGMRMAVHLPPEEDAPTKPQTHDGFIVLTAEHLTQIFRQYDAYDIEHMIISVRDDEDLTQWRAVLDCWESH